MSYKIQKVKSTYEVEHQGVITRLLLVTSVAFYKSSLINQDSRWKVEDDVEFLKSLIKKAERAPSKETIEPLLEMESLYKEFHGVIKKDVPEDQANGVKANRASSTKDLFSNGMRDNQASEAISLQIENSHLENVAMQPTLGELVDEVREANAKARFKWRDDRKSKK